MDNLLEKERNKLDRVSKDALEQLIFKDNIIEDLRDRLNKQQLEYNSLKSKKFELEEIIIRLENQTENDEFLRFSKKRKSLDISNEKNIREKGNDKELEELKIKNKLLESDLQILKDKNKSIIEIEELNKIKFDQLRKKIESYEILSCDFKEKENEFNDLKIRYNSLQNDYEKIMNEKDNEINELKIKLNFSNQYSEKLGKHINEISKNTNNFNHELLNEIYSLGEKNKNLEIILTQNEQKYKDEIFSLKKILGESSKHIESLNDKMYESKNKKEIKDNIGSSSFMNVEELANSFTKSFKEKFDAQNKKISEQKIQILTIQHDLEKINNDLKYEKEINKNLKVKLADIKYNNEKNIHFLTEEAQTQTNLKNEDLESFKIKAKILEDNLIKSNDENDKLNRNIEIFKNENENLTKLLKKMGKENILLSKKIEKSLKKDKNLEKDLFRISDISKMNITISSLKIRENELLERISIYEEKEKKINEKNFNFYKTNNLNKDCNIINTDNSIYSDNNHSSDLIFQNIKENLKKDLIKEKYEIEIKRLDDNIIKLKEENLKNSLDIESKNQLIGELKSKINILENEKEKILNSMSNQKFDYEKIINDLRNEIEINEKNKKDQISEINSNIKNLSDMNTQLSDQFSSLQNKFFLQSKFIQEKNIEIQNGEKIIESLKIDNEELIKNQSNLLENLKKLEKSNIYNLNENEKVKKELYEKMSFFDNFKNKQIFLENENLERIKIINEENENLRISNNNLKKKIQDLNDQINLQKNNIIFDYKNENKEIEDKFKKELELLRQENDELKKERSLLRIQNNELKYEINLLEEQKQFTNQFENIIKKNQNNNNSQNQEKYLNEDKKINIFKSYSSDIIKNEKIIPCDQIINQSNELSKKTDMKNLNEYISLNHFKEKENNYLRNENENVKLEIEVLSKNFIDIENKYKEIKLEFDQLNIEKINLIDKNINLEKKLIKEENINEFLSKDIEKYKLENNGLENEIFLQKTNLTNLSKIVKNIENEKKSYEKIIKEFNEKNLQLEKYLSDYENRNKKEIENFDLEKNQLIIEINNLKNENNNILREIKLSNESKLFFENILFENERIISKHLKEIEELKKENSFLKEQTNSVIIRLDEMHSKCVERNEFYNDRFSKIKKKQEKLINLYETHIAYLKDKFDTNLNDFIVSTNFKNVKLNEKDIEKMKIIMRNLENYSELINQISGREAMISNYKIEIKKLKENISKINDINKKIKKENDDLLESKKNKKTNNFKESEKIKSFENNKFDKITNKEYYSSFLENSKFNEKIIEENMKMKLDISDLNMENELNKVEIKKLEEIIKDLSNEKEIQKKFIDNNELEIEKKEKELLENTKNQKIENNKILEELKKIKEKWIHPDNFSKKIDDYDIKIKQLKNEITRKNDIINSQKSQISNNSSLQNHSNIIYNKGDNSVETQYNEKIKNLNKDLKRKDNIIKEYKENLDIIKITEKKLYEENISLLEKNKILKIDINRKDEVIKDLKDKINNLNLDSLKNNRNISIQKSNDSSQLSIKEENLVLKKLKNELERKEDMIKTLKLKIDANFNEIESLKTEEMKLRKNNSILIEKEYKKNDNLQIKIDKINNKYEIFCFLIKKIFNDLIFQAEKKFRENVGGVEGINLKNDKNSNIFEIGMEILNINKNEINDYLDLQNKDFSKNKVLTEEINNFRNKLNYLVDSDEISIDEYMDLYNSINDILKK